MAFKNSALEPRWLLVITFFAAGLFLGGLSIYIWTTGIPSSAIKLHPAQNSYQYINPLLAVDFLNENSFSQNLLLNSEISGMIRNATQDKRIDSAAVYYRDIEPGIWMGINENQEFSPGNLLKVPIMIAYFKIAETQPDVLDQLVTVGNGDLYSISELFQPTTPLARETQYPVRYLIYRMIVNSDAVAANALFDNVDKPTLNEVFSDLGISFIEQKQNPDFISMKLYSLFFRVLYNATYLDREYSEKALEMLVKTDPTGLNALLPRNVSAAHKVGGRIINQNGQSSYEVYDCGIVYYPSHPYLLCGVVHGADLNAMQKFLEQVGLKIYQETDYKYGSAAE